MKNQSHISNDAAKNIKSALAAKGPDLTSSAQDVVDFYIKDSQYNEVHIVSCNKCGEDLCLEVLNPNQAATYFGAHHRGMRRIVLGTDGPLLSSRKRLDGLMGYRCICGNNTIIAEIEKGLVPQAKAPIANITHIPTIEPHHEALIKLELAKGSHKPDIEKSLDGKTIRQETFTTKRLK